MATDGYVNRWDGVAFAAAEERRLASVGLMPGATAFSARAGRRPAGGGLAVSVGGSPEAVTVTPGAGVIFDPAYASQGPWPFEIPTSKSVNLAARPGTGQSRIDLCIARIYDSGISVGSAKEVKIEVVSGTAGASPSIPTTPALSLALATLTVPASGTVSVTSSTASTVAAGGVLPVATTAERDALTAYRGLVVHNAQTGRLEVHDGTAWQPVTIAVTDTGWVDLTLGGSYRTPTGLNKAQGRRIGDAVYLRGAIERTSGDFTNGVQPATVPTDLHPAVIMRISGQGANTNIRAFDISIDTAGALTYVMNAGGTAPSYLRLDGTTYLAT